MRERAAAAVRIRSRIPRAAPLLLLLLAGACSDLPPLDVSDLRLSHSSSDLARAPQDGAHPNDGGLPILSPCTDDSQCASGLCHLFPGMGTSFCSQTCTVDADCPPPSPGCNKIGICRIQ